MDSSVFLVAELKPKPQTLAGGNGALPCPEEAEIQAH